ncbi:MAG: ABC transporter permease DevC [Cyanobacteriota bacterium]
MLKNLARSLKKTPLAWKQLTRQKTRMAVALAGIAFADMLMFVQMGLLDALFDSAARPHQSLQGDLVVVNPQFESLFYVKSFPRERLYQTLADPEVTAVRSLYVNSVQWRNPENLTSRGILAWGLDPTDPAMQIEDLDGDLQDLKLLNTIFFDRASRPEYGPISTLLQEQNPLSIQAEGKRLEVRGLFSLGASFGADGNLIASDSTFLQLFPGHSPDQIMVGLMDVVPGADVQEVQTRLQNTLGDGVRVLTPEQFGQLEVEYWGNQGIGFIFGMGTAVGFLVGIVIVYQILHSDVSDHLPEYATLKAMGYTNGYLLKVLFQESLFLAALGFVPGVLLSMGLYHITYTATLLPVVMKLDRAITVLILTLIMCSLSGGIVMQKLRSADPADVF